jgi:hypothetical protein
MGSGAGGDAVLKAISLWQPWASLIAIGAKPYETRSWAPPKSLIGQRIAIHAAKKPWVEVCDTLDERTFAAMRATLIRSPAGLRLGCLPLGAIVCTAVLSGAYQVIQAPADSVIREPHRQWRNELGSTFRPAEDLFGDYSPGRWVWALQDVVRLDVPIPCRGRQGWFDVDLEAEQIPFYP